MGRRKPLVQFAARHDIGAQVEQSYEAIEVGETIYVSGLSHDDEGNFGVRYYSWQ